jgi:hypothetical protein
MKACLSCPQNKMVTLCFGIQTSSPLSSMARSPIAFPLAFGDDEQVSDELVSPTKTDAFLVVVNNVIRAILFNVIEAMRAGLILKDVLGTW